MPWKGSDALRLRWMSTLIDRPWITPVATIASELLLVTSSP
jgi:hypothetical protein